MVAIFDVSVVRQISRSLVLSGIMPTACIFKRRHFRLFLMHAKREKLQPQHLESRVHLLFSETHEMR
jgi:hypothetical protein